MSRLLLLAPLCLAGCLASNLVPMAHNGDGIRSARQMRAPLVDRCEAQATDFARAECGRRRNDAIRFVQRLSVGDEVCLAGGPMANGVTARCTVRSYVEDANPRAVKLEVREAAPGSGYQEMDDYWFEQGALVDHYLESAGFDLERPVVQGAP